MLLVISLSECCERRLRVPTQRVAEVSLEGCRPTTRPFRTEARLKMLSPPLTWTEASQERLTSRSMSGERSLALYRVLPPDTTHRSNTQRTIVKRSSNDSRLGCARSRCPMNSPATIHTGAVLPSEVLGMIVSEES